MQGQILHSIDINKDVMNLNYRSSVPLLNHAYSYKVLRLTSCPLTAGNRKQSTIFFIILVLPNPYLSFFL